MIDLVELGNSLDVKLQTILEEDINTNLIDITTIKDENPMEVGISSNVEVKTIEIPSISTNTLLRFNKGTKVCKEDNYLKKNKKALQIW